ncbi:MAG TPA: LLM class flavin-dependent oxidoreductase [Thermomicrobiales bacterium]|nr:LLM class flavin-dependent oxidoreductase [Thermomicrobiales bacterium]
MTVSRPQLGVMFRRERDPATLANEARRVEALGFDQFWIVEDCFYMGGISQAAIALTATSTIQVGIGINPGVAHNPAILAMEYATLARAFPGRLVGGIGHGVAEWMQQIGETVSSPLTAIEEITSAVSRLLRGERLSVDGRYVTLTDVALDPAPDVVPPILLGVRGPKSIALAGRCADGVLLAELSAPDYVRRTRAIMDVERKSPGYIGVYALGLVDNDDPAAALQTIRQSIAPQLSGGGASFPIDVLPFADDLKTLAGQGGADALRTSMPDDWIRQLSVVGDTGDCLHALDGYAAAGADSVILVPMPEWDWSNWLESASSLVR